MKGNEGPKGQNARMWPKRSQCKDMKAQAKMQGNESSKCYNAKPIGLDLGLPVGGFAEFSPGLVGQGLGLWSARVRKRFCTK